jgi:hypothetical protein
MSESQTPPKVFLHKPKKGSLPSGGGDMGEPVRVPQQPPVPVKAPLWYRYRAGVGALLLVNLGIGGYVLSRPRPEIDAKLLNPEKRVAPEAGEKEKTAPTQAAAEEPEWVAPSKPSISEEEQRQVLQWVLDERRKVKGVNKAEKARIDEEKRVIKHLLRESHLPPLV